MKTSWDNFCKEFISNNYIYDLSYKDNIYTIGSEQKNMSSKWIWFLATQHTCNAEPIYLSFNSPQELLENALIEGKTLKSIWNDIVIS